MLILGFLGGPAVKSPPANQETWVQSLGHKEPWRKSSNRYQYSWPGKSHG